MSFKNKLPRGTWIPYEKEPAASLPILRPDHIRQIIVPISTENGIQCELDVRTNDTVEVGQLLGRPYEDGGIPIYSTVSGICSGTYTAHHPILGETTYAIVETMTTEEPDLGTPNDTEAMTSEELLEIIRHFGIMDELDGKPLADKLEAMIPMYPTTIVADAIEDQLYSCSAWAVLREDYVQVLKGLRLAARIICANDYQIATALSKEHNEELSQVVSKDHLMSFEPDYYPHCELLDRGLKPFSIGVQACRALYRAAAYNIPVQEGVITISGNNVSLPINLRVPYGTSLRLALEVAGVSPLDSTIILGDSMKGTVIDNVDIPIISGMTCVLGMKKSTPVTSSVCINCGRCAKVCHQHLLPYEIARRYENTQYNLLHRYHPDECDDCNACSYICPAKRPVAEMVRKAKKPASVVLFDWGPHHDE